MILAWPLVSDTIWEARLLVDFPNGRNCQTKELFLHILHILQFPHTHNVYQNHLFLFWYIMVHLQRSDCGIKRLWTQKCLHAASFGKRGHLLITFPGQQSDFYLSSTRWVRGRLVLEKRKNYFTNTNIQILAKKPMENQWKAVSWQNVWQGALTWNPAILRFLQIFLQCNQRHSLIFNLFKTSNFQAMRLLVVKQCAWSSH